MVEPQDLPRAIQHMRDAADTTKTYPWITEQPEIYAQIRIHLSQDDREYLYGRLLGVAKVHRQALRDVLQTHLSDASEQDRAMFYLMYGTLSEAADIRDAFAYIHAHTPTEESVRTFLPLQKEVLSWLPDQDPVLMRTLLTDKIIPELLLSEVWHAIFDQIYLVDWQDFIVSEYTKLDTRSRESIYFHLKREVLNDEYGRPVSPLLQSLFQECVAQEQDIGIKTRAIVLALHSGFLEDAFSAWKDILQAEFEKLEIKDCERLLEALVTTKDPVCLEFLGEFFPYKIAWSDMYTHRLIQQIAQNLALEGHAFLLGLYEHNPTPVVEHSIEQALPFMRQRVARPTRRRKASSHESLDHL